MTFRTLTIKYLGYEGVSANQNSRKIRPWSLNCATNCKRQTFTRGCGVLQKGGKKRPVSAQYKMRLKMATTTGQADVALMRLVALPCHKKVKPEKVRSRAHLNRRPFAQKSVVHPPWLSSNRRRYLEKIGLIMQVTATECMALRQERKVWCAWINLNKAKFTVFFAWQITCAATDAGHCAPGATRTPQKAEKATPSRSTALHSTGFPVVRAASRRFGRCHFEVHLALCWNRALPPPFFGSTQHPLLSPKENVMIFFWNFLFEAPKC